MTGTVVITALEFTVGYIVNIIYRLNVWDYSSQPYNYMGQICLLFSVFWFLLGILMTFISNIIRYRVFSYEVKPERRVRRRLTD